MRRLNRDFRRVEEDQRVTRQERKCLCGHAMWATQYFDAVVQNLELVIVACVVINRHRGADLGDSVVDGEDDDWLSEDAEQSQPFDVRDPDVWVSHLVQARLDVSAPLLKERSVLFDVGLHVVCDNIAQLLHGTDVEELGDGLVGAGAIADGAEKKVPSTS